jgi:hypothetical protein
MPVAVTLRLDAAAFERIEGLIEAIPDRYIRRGPTCVRLATYGDEVDVAGLDDALAKVIETWRRLSVTLVGIGVFPGEPYGLRLQPIPISELLRRHMVVDEALFHVVGRHCFEYGAWLPLLSIGQTRFPADAVEVLVDLCKEPIGVILDRIDLVRLEPWKVLSSRPLEAAGMG